MNPKPFTVAILTIGDEICIGQITNTNASWMAQELSTLGASVILHSSIGDERTQMLDELHRLVPLADAILITGGLGPTHDDITKPVLCEFFNDSLIEDQDTVEFLRRLFEQRNRQLTDRNRAQALVPKSATVLRNPRGTAPGLLFKRANSLVVAMPGVPQEMKGIMKEHVLPIIQKQIVDGSHGVCVYSTILTSGIPESSLADLLGNPGEFLGGNSLAFLPSTQGVRLRISVVADSLEQGNKQIQKVSDYITSKASRFIVGYRDDSLSSIVHQLLLENHHTLSLAESCTGGLLSSMITDNPGSSEYFLGGVLCYSNESKVRDVNVNPLSISSFGAVSREVAMELAEGVRLKFDSDFALSITGIAGPSGSTGDKPVGTVWIGISDRSGNTDAIKYIFGNDRRMNRERSCNQALLLLKQRIESRNAVELM